MKILELFLKHCWYDMIEAGVKKEEYREIKKFYLTRLFTPKEHEAGSEYKHYDAVRFHKGYTNTTMTLECKGIRIGKGKQE